MTSFAGTFTVMITPFTKDGARVDRNCASGISRVANRTGHTRSDPLWEAQVSFFPRATKKNTDRAAVIQQTNGRVPVLIGTGAEDTREVIRLSREAESLGADGVMIIPPFYSTPTHDECFSHYAAFADAISIPIMVYNNPATANLDITPPLVARLAEIDNVSYIKESTLEVTRVRDILRLCGDRMTVFGGILGFESFVEGASGWVAVGSNAMPNAFAKLYKMTVVDSDITSARDHYLEPVPLIEFVAGHRYVAGSKALLNEMGLSVGEPRPPRLPLPADRTGAGEEDRQDTRAELCNTRSMWRRVT